MELLKTTSDRARGIIKEKIKKIINREDVLYSSKEIERVKELIEDVRINKDEALIKYSKLYDNFSLSKENIKVSTKDIKSAYQECERDFLQAVEVMIKNIEDFHKKTLANFSSIIYPKDKGIILGYIYKPIHRIGVYTPSSKAPLVSSLVMAVVPAKIAKTKEIAVVSPPTGGTEINKYILGACYLLGVEEIYRLGGVWAISALCFGTESVKKVDKIVGPAGMLITLAKKILYGLVDIDLLAGPTEIVIIADKKESDEDIKNITDELCCQGEHDRLALSVVITPDEELATEVTDKINRIIKNSQNTTLKTSLKERSFAILTEDLDRAFDIANDIAPEHLSLYLNDAFRYLNKVENAGVVLLGKHTKSALGDYIAGTNHILPTLRTARFSSSLGIGTYLHRVNFIYYDNLALKEACGIAAKLADLEGLLHHKQSLLEEQNH